MQPFLALFSRALRPFNTFQHILFVARLPRCHLEYGSISIYGTIIPLPYHVPFFLSEGQTGLVGRLACSIEERTQGRGSWRSYQVRRERDFQRRGLLDERGMVKFL